MGVPVAIVTIALAAILAPRVLPTRVPQTQPPDLNRYGATLAEHYELVDAFFRLRIREQSPLVGTPHDALSLSAYEGHPRIVVQRGLVPLHGEVALRAASFRTPVATSAHMMIVSPGGDRFGDCWRLDLSLVLAWLVLAVLRPSWASLSVTAFRCRSRSDSRRSTASRAR